MDAGALVFRRENVSLAELLASVIQDLSVYAELNGTELEMNVPDSVSVITDFKWTKEALSNIIRNAIEHTPGGTVRIRASQSVVAVDLDICDNGCGISAVTTDAAYQPEICPISLNGSTRESRPRRIAPVSVFHWLRK